MPPIEGKTLANRSFETKPSAMLSKVVGTQESCCGLQTTVSTLAITITSHVCLFIYIFYTNNKGINTNDHSGFHTILRIIWSCKSCQSFDFTMDTILLIFALINRPLIFISCVCTIVNNFITFSANVIFLKPLLYLWLHKFHHLHESSISKFHVI